MVIDCLFFLVYVQLSSFLSLIEDSKSFEQRSQTSSRVVGGLHGNLLPPESQRGILLFLLVLPPPTPTPHTHLSLAATRPSSPSSRVILFAPHLSVRLHLQDAVISLAWLDVYCEAEIENGL